MTILGVDIGGSGIKGAPVDLTSGELSADRHRIPTPQPATPEAVIEVVGELVEYFNWTGPIGCTFPAIIKHGVTLSAANVDDSWIGYAAQEGLQARTKCPLVLLNDADAAGIAEMAYGAGKDKDGLVIILTLGTGIGSALFYDGVLLPNTELGHLELHGDDAEHWAAESARQRENLKWKAWGKRVNDYIQHLDFLFSPDLYIIGGGVSKKFDKYEKYIKANAPVIPAALRNEAGIVGAALAAQQRLQPS